MARHARGASATRTARGRRVRARRCAPRRGPGARGGRVRHRPLVHTGIDLCDPASPLRLEPRPDDEPAPAVVATPRIGIAYAGSRGSPSRGGSSSPAARRSAAVPRPAPEPRWTPARSRCSSSRPSARGSPRRPRSTRRAASPRPSSRRTTRSSSARGLDETDQARRCSRTGPAWASGRPTTSSPGSAGRRAAGASTRTQFLEIAETLDAAARLATSLADERRRAAARPRAPPPPAARAARARWSAASTPRASCWTPRRRGSAPLRAAVRVAYDRLRRRLDSLVGSELGGALQEPIVTLRNGRYVVPSAPRPGRASRASSTTRRAAARRCSSSRWSSSSWATPGARRRPRSTRRRAGSSTSCRRSSGPTRTLLLETLEALAQFDFWAAKAQLAAELDGVRPADGRARRGRPAVGAPPGPHRAAWCRSTSGSATATRRS